MTRTASPPGSPTGSPPVSALTPLQACAAQFIAKHGIRAFMDEDYNLTGTRARAVVRPENAELAAAFGVPVNGRELPVAIDKKEVWAVLEGTRRQRNRDELAAFFADPRNSPAPGMTNTQRMYLEWHYRSPNTYRFTLEKPLHGQPAGIRINGWNMESQTTGKEDFIFYTGLLGCTGICCVAADGTAYMSHWDEVCNPRQVEGYAKFAAAHPGGHLHVVGAVGKPLVDALRKRFPSPGSGLEIDCHTKRIYFETTYMVRFSRIGGKVEVAFQESEVCDDYVESCHHGEYGRWFPYGRFSQAFPAAEEEYVPCRFERV